MLRDRVQDGAPRLACLQFQAGLIKRSRFLDEGVPLRCDRNRPVQMRKRAVEISRRARDAGGEQSGWCAGGAAGETGLDMFARRIDVVFGKQHCGQQMAQHRLARLPAQALFAELTRLVAPPRIERGGRAAHDLLGRVGVHAKRIIAVIASEAKQSSAAREAWIALSRSLLAMTAEGLFSLLRRFQLLAERRIVRIALGPAAIKRGLVPFV